MIIRSAFFYLCTYIWTILLGIVCLPYLFLPYIYVRRLANLWISGIFLFLKFTCNITYEIRNREKIPNYPVIVASKHQSAFETLLLFKLIKNSVFIHKKELFFIPIFGLYLKKSNMIAINRSEGTKALRKMLNETKQKILNGHSIIIFPEGTRKIPGEKPTYKTGIAGIYKETEVEILPIALNSGKYWPKNSLNKKSGKIIFQILDLVPAKLNKSEMLKQIELKIEKETNKII